jgi:hypothetical protein
MINFDIPIEQYEGTIPEGSGSSKKPTPGMYVCKIVKSEITKSKSGNPMLVLSLDIAEGNFTGAFSKYPRRWFQVVSNKVGQSVVSAVIKAVVESNVGMIDPNIINSKEFDESVLTGLIIGAKFVEGDKGYLNIETLCAASVARSLAEQPKENNSIPF